MANSGQFKKGIGGPGRKTKYTPELGMEICERIAAGESLSRICKDEHMPVKSVVVDWALNLNGAYTTFSEQYARAREISFLLLADDLLEIADDGRNDTEVDEEGNAVTQHDVIQRSRLRVDTRKWMLSKMLPRVYGDKITQEVTGKDGSALVPVLNVTIGKPKDDVG